MAPVTKVHVGVPGPPGKDGAGGAELAALETSVARVDPGIAGSNGQVLGIAGGVPAWLDDVGGGTDTGYTVIGAGATAADLQAAITAGEQVWLNTDITLTTQLTGGDGLVLHGPGRILYPVADRALTVDATWGTAHAITAFDTVEITPEGRDKAYPVTRIATANAAEYAYGDVVLVSSNDNLSAIVGTEWSGLRGELMMVADADASYIYCHAMLADTYITSPTVRKHPKAKVDIDGPTFVGNGDITATYGSGVRADCAVRIIGAANSRLHMNFENGFSAGLIEVSGWRNDIEVNAVDMHSEPADSAHGYAVSNSNASRYSWVKVHAERCRCATTTNTTDTYGGHPAHYGGPRDIIYYDGKNVLGKGTGFGSHPGGADLLYVNCHDHDSPRGFGARSANSTFIDCTKTGHGYFLYDGSSLYNHGIHSVTRILGGFIAATVAEHDAWNTNNQWIWEPAFYRQGDSGTILGDCELVVKGFTIENKSIQSDLNTQRITLIDCDLQNALAMTIPPSGEARLIGCNRKWALAGAQEAIQVGEGATVYLIDYTSEGTHQYNAILTTPNTTTNATLYHSKVRSLTSGVAMRRSGYGNWTQNDPTLAFV